MKIYHYHPETLKFLGEGVADADPLDEGNWLVPAYATSKPVPTLAANQFAVWNEPDWTVDTMPAPEPAPEPAPLTPEELQAEADAHASLIEAQRAEAYRTESDPLFFKSQRGEATHEEWLAKVAEIKARYV